MTYHGPGQLVVYLLMDIKRLKTGPKSFVNLIEKLVIDTLSELDINAERKTGAPGVYVLDKKIAALGLRISRGCCYHGLSINVDMDLSPFEDIVPCGIDGLRVTQVSDLRPDISLSMVKQLIRQKVLNSFS